MLTKKYNGRGIVAIIFATCLCALLMVIGLMPVSSAAFATTDYTPSITFGAGGYTFLEAEEYNYIYLAADETYIQSLAGKTIGYSATEESTAVYGTNYSSIEDGIALLVTIEGGLAMQINSIQQASYDTGKKLYLSLESTDASYYSIFGNTTAVITFKDKNPDGYVAITSEDKKVYECDGSASFTVQCSPNFFGSTVTFNYGGTAIRDEDYTAPNYVFLPAGTTETEVEIILIDNSERSSFQKYILVNLGTCSSGSEIAAIPNNTVITVNDDESIGVVSFISATDRVLEQDGEYALTITRTGGSVGELHFYLKMETDAAIGVNYVENVSGEYVLYDGEASKTVRLKLREDQVYTDKYTFNFSLSQVEGYSTEFNITTLELTREDSFYPSSLYLDAPKVNGDYIYYLRHGSTDYFAEDYYYIDIYKTAGDNFSCKVSVEMQDVDGNPVWRENGYNFHAWIKEYNSDNTIETYNYSENGLSYTISSDFYVSGRVARIFFPYNHSSYYTGDTNFAVRIYDLSTGVTVYGEENEYNVVVKAVETETDGVYALNSATVYGDRVYIEVVAQTISSEDVTATVIVSQNSVALAEYTLEFNRDISTQGIIFLLVSNDYDAISDGQNINITLTIVGSASVAAGKDSLTVNTRAGRGGTVGFGGYIGYWDIEIPYFHNTYSATPVYTLIEGGNVKITLFRTFGADLIAIDVPLYLVNSSNYFDESEPIAIAHFNYGAQSGEAIISLTVLDGKLLGNENNYLYLGDSSTGDYIVFSSNIGEARTFKFNEIVGYYKYVTIYGKATLTIMDNDDYGKVGFADRTITMEEGEAIALSLIKSGGVDTPVELYVVATNLSIIPVFETMTITNDGYSFEFNYDDDVWHDSITDKGYITLGIRMPVGNTRVNRAGLIENKETITIYLDEDELLGYVGFCTDQSYTYINNGDYEIEIDEDHENEMYINIFVKVTDFYPSKEYSAQGFFQYYIYTVAANGSQTIASCNMTKTEYYLSARIKVEAKPEHIDNVFYIYLGVTRSDTYILENCGKITVSVKDIMETCYISISSQQTQVSENEGEINWTLYRSALVEGDKSLTITNFSEMIEALSEYSEGVEMYVDGRLLTDGTFVWAKEKASIELTLKWLDDISQNMERNDAIYSFSITAQPSQYCAFRWDGDISFAILDNEVSGNLKWSSTYDANTSVDNSYRLESIDGYVPFLEFYIDTVEFSEKASNFAVYFRIIALDDNAAFFLSGGYQDGLLWVFYPGLALKRFLSPAQDYNAYFESASFAITLTGTGLNDTVPENATRYFTYYTHDASISVNDNGLNTLSSRNDSTFITIERNGGMLHDVDIDFSLNEEAVAAGYYLSESAVDIPPLDTNKHYLYIYSPLSYNTVSTITITASYTTGNKAFTEEYTGTIQASANIYYDITASKHSVAEGGEVAFTVTRNQSTIASAVSYSVVSEDERVGERNGVLDFAVGETIKSFTVNTINNTLMDGNYSFNVSIASSAGDICRTALSTVVVTDNDTMLNIMSSKTTFNENLIGFTAADMNNDGLKDVVGILSNRKVVVYYYNGVSFDTKKVSDAELSLNKEYVIKTGHVTADGAESVLIIYSDKVEIIKGNGNITISSYFIQSLNIYSTIEVKNINNNLPGDEICVGNYYYYFDSNYALQARAIYKNNAEPGITYNVTLLNETILNNVLPIKISLEPVKQEYIACISGALYAVFYSSYYGGYILSDALATGVGNFNIYDLYGNGFGSILFSAEGRTNIIQNFLGSSTFTVGALEYYCLDIDAFVEVTILREGLTAYEQSVGFSTIDLTAVKGVDYTAISRNLIFAVGETEKKIRISLKDSSSLPSDTLSFLCALISDNPSISISGEEGKATVYIYDTDNSGEVSIEPTATFNEADGRAYVVMTRTKGAYDFTLDYKFVDRFLMQNGSDYRGVNGTVTFAPNQYSKTIFFDIINDNNYNISLDYNLITGRKFVISLANARSSYDYTLYNAYAPHFGNSEMVVSITDDEKFAEKIQSAEGVIYKVSNDFDLNSDGKKDSFSISDSRLTITLSKDYPNSQSFVYSMDDLREAYGNIYNKLQYSESLNVFVLYGFSGGRTFKVSNNGLVLTGQIDISGGSNEIYNSRSYVGDYDGDGEVDIAYFYLNSRIGVYSVYYAVSSNNYALTLATTYATATPDSLAYTIDTCQVKDITADGCDDLLLRHNTATYSDYFAYCYILNTGEGLVYECILKDARREWEVFYDFYCVKISSGGQYALCLANIYNYYGVRNRSDTSELYDLRVYLYDGERLVFDSGYYFDASVYGDMTWEVYLDPMTGYEYLQSSKGPVFKLQTELKALEISPQQCVENDDYIYLTVNNYSGKADVVNYYFFDNTAINGHHYQGANGYVTFNAGETVKTIAVKLLDNNYYDGSKTFNIYFTSAIMQVIANETVNITIADNENTVLLLPEYSFYQVGVPFAYTVKTNYDIASLSTYCAEEMQVSRNGKTLTFNFGQTGNKNVTIRGYNNQGILIFYQEIVLQLLPTGPINISVDIPSSIAGDSTIDITLRAFQRVQINSWQSDYYYVQNADIMFLNPFTMENITLKTDGSGTARYSLNAAGGDFGIYNIIFSGTSYLGNLTTITVTTTVTNPNGEITGYVLLPDGNTGASGIKVKIAGKTATTDNNGFFSIAVSSGFTYTATINADKANSFYEETTVNVAHNKTTSIISVSLVEKAVDAMTFNVSYFYNEYLQGEKRSDFNYATEIYPFAYDTTNYNYKYGNIDSLTVSNYFSDGSELPVMTINYPSSRALGTVSKVQRITNSGLWGPSYSYRSTTLASFESRTEIFFEFPYSYVSGGANYLRDLEFMVCDSKGNTLRKLTNVNYDWIDAYQFYTRYGDEAQAVINNRTQEYSFMYFMMLTIKSGDVSEGEMLYLRRITNNDVMYYYTGITFGRSLAEKTRDDISSKFDAVKSESIANDLGFLSDCVFGIDLYNVDCGMVKNSDGTVTVYLGYAATSYNLDIVPKTTKRSGSISVSQGNFGAEVSSESEIGIYFGGIFLMRYNETLLAWEYAEGRAMFQGYASNSTTLTFSYEIVMGIEVYVYTQITTGFVSNITVNVEDGELVVIGSDELSLEIKVGVGISLTLVKGEIWGTVGGELRMYYGDLQGTAMSVTFTGGMTAYVLWFEFTQRWYSVTFEYEHTYTPTIIEQVSETLSSVTGSMGDGYTVPIDDSGVIRGDTGEVDALQEMTLVEQTIIGSNPTIVNFGNNKMLVYKQGVSYRGLTYQSLFYKVLRGDSWSGAKRVTSLVRNISEFSVTVSNGLPIIAFTHTIADGNLAMQMQYVDVSAAIYNTVRDNFEISEITNDNLPDANPLIVAGNGHVILIFDKTYRNNYSMDMTLASALFNERDLNYKMYCIFNGSSFSRPEIFVRGAYNTIDEEGVIVGNKLYYAVIADMDGNITTDSDTEVLSWSFDFVYGVWSGYENITNNAYAETQLELVIQNGIAIYLWLNKYGINYRVGGENSNVINTYEQGNITYFEVTTYGNNVVIAWTESTVNIEEEESNYVYFLVIDGSGNVGRRKALIGTDQIIISYALAATDNEVYAVYCMSTYDSTLNSNNVYSIESIRVPFVMTASAENIFTATGRWRAGETETIYFDVTNYGDYLLSNVIVTVRANNASGTVLYTATINSLKIGETKTLSFSTVISEGLYGLFITLGQRVSGASPIGYMSFSSATLLANESNNISNISFSMQSEQASFESLKAICQDNTVKIIAGIENLGDVATSGVIKLYVIKDFVSTLLLTKSFTLAYGENADILMELATSLLRDYRSESGMLSFAAYIESETADISTFAQNCSVMFKEIFKVTLKNGKKTEIIENDTGVMDEPPTPTKTGFNFAGWYLDEDLTIKAEFPLQLTGDITLYAKWTVKPMFVVGLSVGGAIFIVGIIFLALFLKKNNRYKMVIIWLKNFFGSIKKKLSGVFKKKGKMPLNENDKGIEASKVQGENEGKEEENKND